MPKHFSNKPALAIRFELIFCDFRKEVLHGDFFRWHPVDRLLLVLDGVVGHRGRKRLPDSAAGHGIDVLGRGDVGAGLDHERFGRQARKTKYIWYQPV